MRLWTRVLTAATALVAAAAIAPAAMASTTASLSLDQSAGTSAGGSHDLGLNLSFADSGTDSPKDLTLKLPPGLLANVAADNGQCLKSNQTPSSACEIGSGTVTVHPNITLTSVLGLPIPVPASIPVSVAFYLVPPPAAGDLAGIEVYGLGQQIGSTGPISIRPSGDPDGVGATVALTLPDTLPASILGSLSSLVNGAVGISITQIQSTFDSLRYPTTCPAKEPLVATVDSYQAAGVQTLSQPLSVGGCSSLTFDPTLAVSAVKDSSDKDVALTTNVTEGSSDAPNAAIALSFPTSEFAANLRALSTLCLGQVSGCATVGSVTAVSPLYPTPLTGQAYLTGSGSGLSLTLTFPQPFPLTLVGAISLTTNTASFGGLPDIPLTQLSVKLNGGSKGLFATACRQPSGTATAQFTDQNGDRTHDASAQFSVSGCKGASSGSGSGGAGAGSGSQSSGSSTSSSTPSDWNGGTHLVANAIAGLTRGKPSLRFTVAVNKHAAKFTRLTVTLPTGLAFRSHRSHRRTVVRGVSVKGAKVRSLRLSHRHLVITLRRSARRATVTLGTRSLKESRGLRAHAQHKTLERMRLTVAVRDARRQTRTLTVTIRKLHL